VSNIAPKDLDQNPIAGPGGAQFLRETGVVWEASEGQIVNLGVFLLCGLLFWTVIPLIWAGLRYWSTAKHRYVLTDQRLRESAGIIFKSTEELELYRVKDLSVEQPPLQALVGKGRVILRTSDRSSPVVVLNAVSQPLHVADLVRHHVERCRALKGVREIDS
jgi:membrane protein YdbS with pleckstrin-like domain